MKLLIIRHGIAEDKDGFARKGDDDALRPLTRAGKKRMRRNAAGIRKLMPHVTLLATSALTRAAQTGTIVAREYDGLKCIQIPALSPRKTPQTLLQWLRQQPADATIALVGHEPHLGVFISWMLTGLQDSFVVLKKGGACLLEIDGELKASRAKLIWFLKPKQLRDMG